MPLTHPPHNPRRRLASSPPLSLPVSTNQSPGGGRNGARAPEQPASRSPAKKRRGRKEGAWTRKILTFAETKQGGNGDAERREDRDEWRRRRLVGERRVLIGLTAGRRNGQG